MSAEKANHKLVEYETIWYLADFWPGEYPPRFSVIKDGVELSGRAEMKLTAPKTIKCPVPKLATYSPWNNARNQADNLRYWVVSKVSIVTISNAVNVPAQRDIDGGDVTLKLKQGDTLQYLVYGSEGFAKYHFKGEDYTINEGDFEGKAAFDKNRREDDLWLRLSTTDGEHCWVLYSDAVKTDGIIQTDIEGFGVANDLPDPANLSLKGVAFDSGSADLSEASKPLLDDLANKLRLLRGFTFEVGGYTDSIGNSASNEQLSQDRADAVVSYLINRGTDPAMLTGVGYGEADPIADNGTPEGRTLNRRVELKLLNA